MLFFNEKIFFSPVCCSFSYSDALDLEVSIGCAVMFGSDCRFPLEILLLLLCSLIDLSCFGFYTRLESGCVPV
jgi:hypothetical protein